MSIRNEIARLHRAVDELDAVARTEARQKLRAADTDRRFVRNEIEVVIQRLSELRERLGS